MNEQTNAPTTSRVYGKSGRASTTIAPEHMREWERLTRSGLIHRYDYDPEHGYRLTSGGWAEMLATASVWMVPDRAEGAA